jgi:hypothetical protein
MVQGKEHSGGRLLLFAIEREIADSIKKWIKENRTTSHF